MPLKYAKAKGTRAEHRAARILEAAGYYVIRAGGSLGVFDIVGIGPGDLKCVSVKAGTKYVSAVEREQLELLTLPTWASKEIWRFPDRCKAPLIERIR